MTLRVLGLTALLTALAACGVDGEPERPEPRPLTSLSVTGSIGVGITDA